MNNNVNDLVDYLNNEILMEESLSSPDLLDALASLGLTLVSGSSTKEYVEAIKGF